MSEQTRTPSRKAIIFQTNGEGSGDIIADAPTSNLALYVFEIHNYQAVTTYDPCPQVVLRYGNYLGS